MPAKNQSKSERKENNKVEPQGKLALVLTGDAARGAAHIGALLAMQQVGLKPDFMVGVSAGALIGALYAAYGLDAEKVKEVYYKIARTKSWQDLTDIDFAAIHRGLFQPSEVQGLVKGQALFDTLRQETALGRQGFQHLGTDLFILATDLNTGKEVVFSRYTEEENPFGEAGVPNLYARSAQDLEKVNVATAVRASMSIPGLFQPVKLGGKCLVDGRLRKDAALRLAALLPDVTNILCLDLGYADQLLDDFGRQSFAAVMTQALAVATAPQWDVHTADPVLANKHVRIINPGIFKVAAGELSKTQEMVESARRTLTDILSQEHFQEEGQFSAAALFGKNGRTWTAAFSDAERWTVEVSKSRNDLIALTDKKSPIVQEMSWEFDEYLEKAGESRLQEALPISVNEWSWESARKSLGGQFTWFFFANFVKDAARKIGQGIRWAYTRRGVFPGVVNGVIGGLIAGWLFGGWLGSIGGIIFGVILGLAIAFLSGLVSLKKGIEALDKVAAALTLAALEKVKLSK